MFKLLTCIFLLLGLVACQGTTSSEVDAVDTSRIKQLKVEFIQLLSNPPVDLAQAKYLLSQIPPDPKAFHNYDDIDPSNPQIANLSIILLHYLLNKFMLAGTIEEKTHYLMLMQMGIERGMDVTAPYKDDPPLYLKSVMVKEMNLTVNIINAAKKYMTQEIIARSRKMSRFLNMIYTFLAEVVPTAKLLLHVEKISETASNRTSVESATMQQPSRKDIALTMLHSARLDKPAVKASELLVLSPTYRQLVDQVTTNNSFSKSVSLLNIIRSLDDYANAALTALVDAMKEDTRASVAFEHFFDLHVIPDDAQRNAFHYLCMARSTITLNTLMKAYSEDWQGDSQNSKVLIAERIITSLEFTDQRGHTPLSYCAMRYGRRRHDDVGSTMIAFLDMLKTDLTDPDYINHVDLLKEVLYQDEDSDSSSIPSDRIEDEDAMEMSSTEVEISNAGDGKEINLSASKSSKPSLPTTTIDESGGWNTNRLNIDPAQYPYLTDEHHCAIKQVFLEKPILNEEFFLEYLNSGTPVIFRGAALNHSTSHMTVVRHVFRKDNFLKVYGSKKVSASTLPYGESFGVKTLSKTMRQVANADRVVRLEELSPTNSSSSSDGDIPLYTFVIPSAEWSPRISKEIPFPEAIIVPNQETGQLMAAYSTQLQFYLGAAGTGAPIHYHGPAINTLAYGEKKWVLFPPDYSFYSTTPALSYFLGGDFSTTHPMSLDEGITKLDEQFMRGLQCTQRAGDIIFVPSLWGHATLNMKQSIGVAHEFSIETFIME